ncbi:hypothetical protein [Sulfitobacter sp. SK012]|uniref:hypothetical protein n=1 Tax=Sulfitobacter sp. SK012 TaxID=1389005 RepID=UPI0020C7B10A|nr:hypothetical protein [Sulfitobacter sp. SK012]
MIWLSMPAFGEAISLLGSSSLGVARSALIQTRAEVEASNGPRRAASLFAGLSGAGMFAPLPDPVVKTAVVMVAPSVFSGSGIERLRNLIGQAESRKHGYDAVQHGAKIRPAKRPTELTIDEIYAWIKDTPGQPHAIGRYQFIPPTLRRLVKTLGVPPQARFSPALQDRLADVLLAEAGLHKIKTGKIARHKFMNNLAMIWAGLPNSSGQSHYHGYAGNKASMSWAKFDAEMAQIFPS